MLEWFSRINPCKSRRQRAREQSQQEHSQRLTLESSSISRDENLKALLACEQRSKQIVTSANERRQQIKNRARVVADRELNQLRKKYEKKAMEKEAESETIRAQAGSEIQTETDKKLAIIAEQVEANKPQIFEMLHAAVIKIEPTAHRNLNLSARNLAAAISSTKKSQPSHKKRKTANSAKKK